MTPYETTDERAVRVLENHGFGNSARDALGALRAAGIYLASDERDEMVCRWVNVAERAVPREADTIIRTITRTLDGVSTSTTHWLDGLRGPRL
ncbi:MAG TPA: hypothetical protein VH142_16970 [Polyangiaceae bacterium]|jgi:hypothetical protein|nr:hypothetical protein [Polyangiaceae bacterium]